MGGHTSQRAPAAQSNPSPPTSPSSPSLTVGQSCLPAEAAAAKEGRFALFSLSPRSQAAGIGKQQNPNIGMIAVKLRRNSAPAARHVYSKRIEINHQLQRSDTGTASLLQWRHPLVGSRSFSRQAVSIPTKSI